MTQQPQQTWPYTIYFQGQPLSHWAISLDVLGMYCIPDVSDDFREWFWRFSICVGRVRDDSADSVLRHVGPALEFAVRNEPRVLAVISEHFPPGTMHNPERAEPPAIQADWLAALRAMAEIAAHSPRCFWIAGSEEERQVLLDYMRDREGP